MKKEWPDKESINHFFNNYLSPLRALVSFYRQALGAQPFSLKGLGERTGRPACPVSRRISPEYSNCRLPKNEIKARSAFTLIELLIVIVIFSVIIGFTFTNLFGKRQSTDLSSAKQQIAALLREAQSRAANQDNGENWGVYFGNPTSSASFYSLYSSSSYSQSAVMESYRLPTTVRYSAPTSSASIDINFSQIFGLPSQATTVIIYIISNASESSSIAIATSGAITY